MLSCRVNKDIRQHLPTVFQAAANLSFHTLKLYNSAPAFRAKILNLLDRDARSLAMAENLQREDLNVYEETFAVVGLIGALP